MSGVASGVISAFLLLITIIRNCCDQVLSAYFSYRISGFQDKQKTALDLGDLSAVYVTVWK